MQKRGFKISLAALVMLVMSVYSHGQDYVYGGPLPCLGAQTFVNGFLEITSPPPGAYTFEWTVTSPAGVITTNSSNNPLGITFDEVGCWHVVLEVNGSVVQDQVCGVEIFQEPTAAINPISVMGCTPFSPLIDDASIPGTGAIDSWTWSMAFCPTITDQDINGQCAISSPGLFDLTLSVVDVNGCFNTLAVNDII